MTTAIAFELGPEEFSRIIAENIRAVAARRGVNQSEIARQLGLSHGTVSLRWNGKRDWPLDDIARVAALLGTTPWELCQPAPEYERSQAVSLAPVHKLPRLDSNQRPSDYTLVQVRPVTDLGLWRGLGKLRHVS